MPLKRLSAAFLLLVLLAAPALAQRAEGNLVEVRVEGTTNYEDIVRTLIVSRRGTAAAGIDLEAERNRVYSLGAFSTVTVEIETSPLGPILHVRVVENPRIGEIELEGADSLPNDGILDALRSTNLLEEGRVLNTVRAEEAKRTIQRVYRTAGMPFDVGVELVIEEAPEFAESADAVPVRLIYEVDESAEVDSLVFSGNTVVPDERLEELFGPLVDAGEFDPEFYSSVLQRVSTEYGDLGYRGSGVDAEASTLQGGVLNVVIQELVIDSIDTTALGVDPADLGLQPGDLFNFDTLLAEVKRLAQGRSSDVQLQAGVMPNGGVRVTFRAGAPETAGPVTEVRFEGNTVFTDDELRSLLGLKIGDTFTSVLADADFGFLVSHYQEAGYRVVPQPDYSYDDGVYVQRLSELRLDGYELSYDGEPSNTQAYVVERYLPKPGTVVNDNHLVAGLRSVAELGVVEVLNYSVMPSDEPGGAIVGLQLRKLPTGELRPAAQYATDTGLSASLAYSERNFLGMGNIASASVEVTNTDVGLMLGGSLSYEVPWLYFDFLDFQEVPTSASISVFSLVANNQPLSVNGQTTAVYPGSNGVDRVMAGEYTSRSTGVGLSVGRPLGDDLYLSVSGNGSHTDYYLEPPSEECELENGRVVNASRCSLPFSVALPHLPLSGMSAFVNARLSYDDRDNSNFPTEGVSAYGSVGVGFGNDMIDPSSLERTGYVYEQVTAGVRTYLKLSDVVPAYVENPNHVFAVRFDAGHQFGGLYPTSKRFVVGRTADFGPQIRGYSREDLNLSRTYATSSLEYRYDFGLSTAATQTVIGVLFVDVGWASSVPDFNEYGTPLLAGAGLGVQVNLGFGGVLLPAIRLDYGFSERHPYGVFSFRVGPVF